MSVHRVSVWFVLPGEVYGAFLSECKAEVLTCRPPSYSLSPLTDTSPLACCFPLEALCGLPSAAEFLPERSARLTSLLPWVLPPTHLLKATTCSLYWLCWNYYTSSPPSQSYPFFPPWNAFPHLLPDRWTKGREHTSRFWRQRLSSACWTGTQSSFAPIMTQLSNSLSHFSKKAHWHRGKCVCRGNDMITTTLWI